MKVKKKNSAIEPMEALLVDSLPTGDNWQYEPKWDGFRCIVFKKDGNVTLQSKAQKPLERYFPELVKTLSDLPLADFILDGEIIVPTEGGLDFDKLLQRIHPAASRILKLSKETPAHLLVFDLLSGATGAAKLESPLSIRRKGLEKLAKRYLKKHPLIHLSPATLEMAQVHEWLERPGLFLDGIIAKRIDLPYVQGKRTAMQKFKTIRTADCVVGGFRYAEKSPIVGSLLLGLYEDGLLHHVGFTSGIATEDRTRLLKKLLPLKGGPGFTGNAPGGPSRWSTERSAQWEPLRTKLVVEVSYDHVTNKRFRHGTKIIRFRPDKLPSQCTMEQLGKPGKNNALFEIIS